MRARNIKAQRRLVAMPA
ncbi:unnamed protein product, partial [Didymodactylos carnosus]